MATAKLVVVLAIALLAIAMAGSSHKVSFHSYQNIFQISKSFPKSVVLFQVLAKATEGSLEQYMQVLIFASRPIFQSR